MISFLVFSCKANPTLLFSDMTDWGKRTLDAGPVCKPTILLHCVGHWDGQDAPGFTTEYISPRRCRLICKGLMALNSLSGWEVTASKPELSQSNFTAPPVSIKLPRGGREEGKEKRERSSEIETGEKVAERQNQCNQPLPITMPTKWSSNTYR